MGILGNMKKGPENKNWKLLRTLNGGNREGTGDQNRKGFS